MNCDAFSTKARTNVGAGKVLAWSSGYRHRSALMAVFGYSLSLEVLELLAFL